MGSPLLWSCNDVPSYFLQNQEKSGSVSKLFEIFLYLLAIIILTISFLRDRNKTKIALLRSWKAFLNILPALAGVFALIGLVLALLPPDLVIRGLGQNSGFGGMLLTSIIGAITLIPAFIAYPMAATLLDSGAGIMQIVVFVSTLTMVGTVTAPLEARFIGWKATLLRNGFAYLYSFLAALIIGVILK